jgi:hypothetical protein
MKYENFQRMECRVVSSSLTAILEASKEYGGQNPGTYPSKAHGSREDT